jgi:predicted kinase
MTTVHMICGYLGAGKTTFARKVEERERALRFSVDEMYLRLFADGPTYELDSAAMGRLLDVIEDHWTRAAVQGISVVLDLGFWNREFRERTRARAEELGARVRLYFLQCSDDLARERCLSRNGTEGAFLISPEGFEELKARFEAPSDDEKPQVIDTGCHTT